MCGIAAAFHTGEKPINANKWVLDTFENQYERGVKGFGIIGFSEQDRTMNVIRATEPAKFMFDIHTHQFPCLVMHHRQPTSTDNKLDQTHPILVNNGSLKHNYMVIHNGVLHSHKAVHDKHVNELGFVYSTEYTDKGSRGSHGRRG